MTSVSQKWFKGKATGNLSFWGEKVTNPGWGAFRWFPVDFPSLSLTPMSGNISSSKASRPLPRCSESDAAAALRVGSDDASAVRGKTRSWSGATEFGFLITLQLHNQLTNPFTLTYYIIYPFIVGQPGFVLLFRVCHAAAVLAPT